jgi:uncharacterized protein
LAGSTAFNIITKPTGSRCNLTCDYCYFLKKEKRYASSNFKMDEAQLEIFIKQYIQSQPPGEVIFTWQGGEPTLMGISFFEKVISLQQQYCPPDKTILNSLQTNGTLLDDDWGQFLANNQFLVGLSMDGPPHLHNTYRKTKNGGPTHGQVMNGLNILTKHCVKTNILTCVNAANYAYPLDVYHYFRDTLNMQYLQFIPIVERANKTGNQRGEKLTSRSISGKEYGDFLITIFDEWISQDVGKMFVQIFEVCVGVWSGFPASICIFNPTCGACLALEHNGNLFSCDHYVQNDAFLGNISEIALISMVFSPQQIQFGKNKKSKLPPQCTHCDVRFICNGGCPKNRILTPKNETQPINHLCDGYKSFFHHIDQPMKMISSLVRTGRPASDILNLLT